MIDIPSNFPKGRSESETICFCGQREDMNHIYECDIYNEEVLSNYEEIYNGEINEQIMIFKRFEENFEKRVNYLEILKLSYHVIQTDPLHFCSNG